MRQRVLALIFALCFLFVLPRSASASELDDVAVGSISQNCASIQLRLKNVQRTDSKNRVQLGSYYEMINTNLMLNLNLRLVKNSLADPDLSEQQTTFSNERERFKTEYTNYQKELDALIDINCREQPKEFYDQLKVVRAKRAKVSRLVEKLRDLIKQHREAVVELKESL